jgi:hypothetical protein
MGVGKICGNSRASPFNKNLSTLLEINHYSTTRALLLYGGPFMHLYIVHAASNNKADFRCRCCYLDISMRFM